ncbi:hypothetical protein AGMMS50293_24900 [Spirochaetia bacterium]|nr:hypothetical protein AGMMS50293_24900 [Spirochaetia bacterium]
MWQYVMNGKKQYTAVLFFAALFSLHIAVFALADFSGLSLKVSADRQNSLLFFDLGSPAAESPAMRDTAQNENPLPVQNTEVAEALDSIGSIDSINAAQTAEAYGGADESHGPEEIATSGADGAGVHTAAETTYKMSESDYIALIMQRLEEKKVYPLAMRKRGIEGDMAVQFTIRPDGSLAQVQPGNSKAHPFLVQATLETVRSAGPFPTPVMVGIDGDFSLQVVIKYQLD